MSHQTIKHGVVLGIVLALVGGLSTQASAGYVRLNKMFDVPQTARPTWGANWCAPTAVGNSFAWLAKEYGGDINKLMKVNGTGAALSAEDVIGIIGVVDMGTDPAGGTKRNLVEQAKKDYISRHGLAGKITVESQVALPKAFVSDGSFAGWQGARVTKKWLKDQLNAGQDVEFAVSYYEKIGGKWFRKGGHVDTWDGGIPGEAAGGHQFSLAGLYDPFGSGVDTDFEISFTDPGRDDLVGDYGAIAHDQYWLTDYAGVDWYNTESTYNVIYDSDPFGIGIDSLLLDGYQGAGDWASDGAARTLLTVLEAGWAESIPEPATLSLLALGGLMLAARRRRQTW